MESKVDSAYGPENKNRQQYDAFTFPSKELGSDASQGNERDSYPRRIINVKKSLAGPDHLSS